MVGKCTHEAYLRVVEKRPMWTITPARACPETWDPQFNTTSETHIIPTTLLKSTHSDTSRRYREVPNRNE